MVPIHVHVVEVFLFHEPAFVPQSRDYGVAGSQVSNVPSPFSIQPLDFSLSRIPYPRSTRAAGPGRFRTLNVNSNPTTRMIDDLARTLSEYHKLNHALEPADCIVGFGTNDPRVAERAAELHLAGLAPWLVFTGGISSWTHGLYSATEARAFADIAMARGVPQQNVLLEERASNTGENIRFTRALLEEAGLPCRKLILVQKPYMERRTYATCKQFWPEPDIRVTSPRLAYEDYPLPWLPMREVIQIMVGDLHRIVVYPDRGFQIAQEIPGFVMEAFHKLVALGYDKHLVPDAIPEPLASTSP